MKMFKKLMAVALAGVMALVVLTGCASNAVKTKEILANLNDMGQGKFTLEDAGEADAAKAIEVLKEFKAKEAYKDKTVEDMIGYYENHNTGEVVPKDRVVADALKAKLVVTAGSEDVVVSYAKVNDYKSATFTEAQYKLMAYQLDQNGMPIDVVLGDTKDTGKISMKVDTIGDDTYVIAVIRVAKK